MSMILSALELWSSDIVTCNMTYELYRVCDIVWHQAPKRVYLQTAPSPPGGGPFGVTDPLRGGAFSPCLVRTHGASGDASLAAVATHPGEGTPCAGGDASLAAGSVPLGRRAWR